DVGHTSIIDFDGRCHGAGWQALGQILARADLVLTVADLTWFDELAACETRPFVDGDPAFTQASALASEDFSSRLSAYNRLFTYATRLGRPGCLVPDAGREWFTTTPTVATRLWPDPSPPPADGPLTALLHWAAGQPVVIEGRELGHKDRQFRLY